MIVRSVESGWEIVFQSAHALLASQIAMHLRLAQTTRYWPETLAAVIDHDELNTSFGKNVYLTDLGAPKDFTQVHFKARERYDEVQRRIDSGYRKHRWIGLLAARHAEVLYRREAVPTGVSVRHGPCQTAHPALAIRRYWFSMWSR